MWKRSEWRDRSREQYEGVVFSFDKPVRAILLLVSHFKVPSFLKTLGRSWNGHSLFTTDWPSSALTFSPRRDYTSYLTPHTSHLTSYLFPQKRLYLIPHTSHLTPHILPFPPEEILFEFCAAQTWWLLAVRPPLRRSDTWKISQQIYFRLDQKSNIWR